MSLIRKHGAVLQAWACLDLVLSDPCTFLVSIRRLYNRFTMGHWGMCHST